MRRYITATILLILSLLLGLRAAAQGVFISGDEGTINMSNIDVTYFVNRDEGTIRMMLQPTFAGTAERYLWLIPVPDDEPVVEPGYLYTPHTYEVQVVPPDFNPCGTLFTELADGPGGDAGYDTAEYDEPLVLAGDEALDWLSENDYFPDDTLTAAIQDYAREGLYFLAIPITKDFSWAFANPLAITYHGDTDAIRLPIHLTAAAPELPTGINTGGFVRFSEVLPLHVRIFADVPYAPINYAYTQPDLTQMHSGHPLEFAGLSYHTDPYSAYLRLLQSTVDTNTLVVSYAGPAEEDDFGFVTAFYGQIARGGTAHDPLFAPAPEMPELTVADVSDLDALQFYRCSTRTLAADRAYDSVFVRPEYFPAVRYADIATDLPAGFTYIDEIHASVRHPVGWQMSEIEMFDEDFGRPYSIYAFSPESVTLDMLENYTSDDAAPPILAIYEPALTGDYAFPEPVLVTNPNRAVNIPRPPFYRYFLHQMLRVELYVSPAEYNAHQAMYDAMLAYPRTQRFTAHPDLAHTLYLSPPFESAYETDIAPGFIGFPEGWIEYYDNETGVITFLPQGVTDREQGITLTFQLGFGFGADMPFGNLYEGDQTTEEWIEQVTNEFGLLPAALPILEEAIAAYEFCELRTPPLAFEHDGRRGYLVSEDYLAFVSVPVDSVIPDSLLYAMASSWEEGFILCV